MYRDIKLFPSQIYALILLQKVQALILLLYRSFSTALVKKPCRLVFCSRNPKHPFERFQVETAHLCFERFWKTMTTDKNIAVLTLKPSSNNFRLAAFTFITHLNTFNHRSNLNMSNPRFNYIFRSLISVSFSIKNIKLKVF